MDITCSDFAKQSKMCFWTVFRYLSHSYCLVENVFFYEFRQYFVMLLTSMAYGFEFRKLHLI